jgi:mannan polymerase II complex ANP1 subunit
MANKDIDVWRPLPDWLGGEQPYDLNSWQESETALALADTLDEDAVIVEGYAEYATWRPHLAYLRDPYGDPDMEMEIDGVGGVSILAKAKVFRSGVHFPAFSFEKHAETEGFGKVRQFVLLVPGPSETNSMTDGQAHEVLSGRLATLHHLALVRAFGGRHPPHGGDGE